MLVNHAQGRQLPQGRQVADGAAREYFWFALILILLLVGFAARAAA